MRKAKQKWKENFIITNNFTTRNQIQSTEMKKKIIQIKLTKDWLNHTGIKIKIVLNGLESVNDWGNE